MRSHANQSRSHLCPECGKFAARDAIRLKSGFRYCPTGECRKAAERIIAEARRKIEFRKEG